MTVGSLFSGIGGLDLGLERAGMRVLWQCEQDPFCRRVLAKHWPGVPCYKDIKTVDWTAAEPVDLVSGGFPCQPVSLAGERKGNADPRWLWPEFARCLRVLRPRYALIENVPGLLTCGFNAVLCDLAALGFDAEWSIVSACSVGAPHTRERLFIFAYPNSVMGSPRIRLQQQRRDRQTGKARGCGTGVRDSGWLETVRSNGRSNDGISYRMDSVRALGNAVVPQVAEAIGRAIMSALA